MVGRKKRRMEALEDRISEQSILIHHQETMMDEKDREIRLLREQVTEMVREREERIETANEQEKEGPTFEEIMDEWLNGKKGEE